jgi:hypothetical protein
MNCYARETTKRAKSVEPLRAELLKLHAKAPVNNQELMAKF